MHFLIVGPGAMGCLFAARLKMAGYRVTLVDYIAERADRIDRQGIMVEGVSGEYIAKVPVVTGPPSDPPDLALICVKGYKTREACLEIKDGVGPETVVVTLQNGIGNIETLEEIFGKGKVLGGVTAEGATLIAPGRIRHAGKGDTVFGPRMDSRNAVEMITGAFNQAGFKARSEENIQDLIWGKLIINVGINALAAITRLKNGRLPHLTGSRRIMEEAVQEAVAVAKAKKIQIPYPDPLGRVLEVCRATSENIASMLQDVLNRKPTEIDSINGAIVQQGALLGIPAPVNSTLTDLVKTIQSTYGETCRCRMP